MRGIWQGTFVLLKALAYISIFSIFIHLTYSSGYLLDYYVNTDYYLEHCVNKNRPELNCDGQCILAQKLREAQTTSDGQEDFQAPVPVNVDFLFTQETYEPVEEWIQVNQRHDFGWINHYSFLLDLTDPHPPSELV